VYQLGGQSEPLLLVNVCRPSILLASVTGARTPGADGRHLRGRYVINRGQIRPTVANLGGDAADGPIEVEFDLAGAVHLNWAGSFYLVGGKATETYDLRTHVVEAQFEPQWHELTTLVSGTAYTVPRYHSRLRTAGAAVTYTGAGFSGVLDHWSVPVVGDSSIVLGTADQTLISGWYG